MKQLTAAKQLAQIANDDVAESWGTCLGILFCIVIVGFIVLLCMGLEKYGCESKKSRGLAGYKNRQC